MPKVSVVIPCYNYARYLADAVESVMAQTYRDFEVVIVNDGSPDNTEEVARGLMDKFGGEVVRLVNQENAGLPTARNKGIEASRGEFILPLDADDRLRPRYLEKTVPLLESDPALGLAYTWGKSFGEESRILMFREFTKKVMLKHEGPHPTALYRKSAWARVGGYKPVMNKGYEDWEFYFSLLEAGYKGKVVEEPLFDYRIHGFTMREDVIHNHSLAMCLNIKLLHPRLYEPLLFRISPRLARAVILLKYRVRDPLMHHIYMNYPGVHRLLRAVKYNLFVR